MGLRDLVRRILPARPSGEAPAEEASAADLTLVEERLRGVPEGSIAAARLYNRAGDLYLAGGENATALGRYGRAIDAYMHAGQYDSAIAVCRKILRLVPNVVRTRCTLAWLCIGKGFLDIARGEVTAYVQAAKREGHEMLAAQQLRLMARYVGRRDFREFVATLLLDLGDRDGAARVQALGDEASQEISWNPIVFAALLTPEELRRAAEQGVDLQAPYREDVIDRFMIHPD